MMTIRTKVVGLIIGADETSVPVHGAHCSTPGYPLLADQRPRLGRRGVCSDHARSDPAAPPLSAALDGRGDRPVLHRPRCSPCYSAQAAQYSPQCVSPSRLLAIEL